ncbi:unnamed protein product, partial [Musa hybrid cultivar]
MWFASDEWAMADCLRAICGGSDSALIVSLPSWVVGIVVGQTREGGAACFLSQSKEDSGTRYVCIYLYR